MNSNTQIKYIEHLNVGNKFTRLLWNVIWILLFRSSPVVFHVWRNLLLKMFGACIAKGVHVYPDVRIWAPWNLEMAQNSSLGPGVICYSVDKVLIGEGVVISQYAHLCTAGHDIRDLNFQLTHQPIIVDPFAWVAADAFIGPGVHIGEGAVVGARACVFKSVKPWVIVAGNPARVIGHRKVGG
jgi:putative colanic acid biosynthesis acetyltransferase WcaF